MLHFHLGLDRQTSNSSSAINPEVAEMAVELDKKMASQMASERRAGSVTESE
jgi:hypothetical protein